MKGCATLVLQKTKLADVARIVAEVAISYNLPVEQVLRRSDDPRSLWAQEEAKSRCILELGIDTEEIKACFR